ncbi:hypothetical protein AC622_06135 [Bacillus sp. FJAT-27916]|uniref:GNAT family N-acetyltransferase n=1 Tax=Bacillaceae TaxID=186817 RepID=UPI0006717384|nr:GNAT family N-acetyltransferase [Bacillus sp. FJAT-27916]KMY43882.1 hypothetical protein AC622_06135 [Bacillus sp. FJAT-27916]
MEIRPSRYEDYEQLVELENSIWNDENTPMVIEWESPDEYAEQAPPGSLFVAIEKGRVAGYISLKNPTMLEANQHVWELAIGVHPDFWRSGTGSKLLAYVEERALLMDIHKICLRVLSTNKRAIAFYEKNGYLHQGRLVNEFFIGGKYVDDCLMYKLLG